MWSAAGYLYRDAVGDRCVPMRGHVAVAMYGGRADDVCDDDGDDDDDVAWVSGTGSRAEGTGSERGEAE